MEKNTDKRMSFISLSVPIFVEMLIRSLYLSTDTFMLSMYSDKAAAAVGLISQLIFFLMIFYSMISSGCSVYISQLLGANKREIAQKAIFASIVLIIIVSILINILVQLNMNNLLKLFNLENDVYYHAREYLLVFSVFSISMALNSTISSIYKSYGYAKQSMIVNFICLSINAVGNYCFIFGKFGFPVLGTKGVAISSVLSQGLGFIILLILTKKYHINFKISNPFKISKNIYFKILKVGIPSSMIILSQNISQLIILSFIALMGTVSLTAYSYTSTLQRNMVVFLMAIAPTTTILTGYFVGKNKIEHAYKMVYKYFFLALIIALTISSIVAIFGDFFSRIFTNDIEVINVVKKLLIISIFYETGRVFNMIFMCGLRGSGDVKFSSVVGIITIWLIAVGFSRLLSINLGFGIIGIWIAMSIEHWVRGFLIFYRWKSKKWIKNSLVKN